MKSIKTIQRLEALLEAETNPHRRKKQMDVLRNLEAQLKLREE